MDAGVNVTPHAALTDEAIARFHRVGFMVVTGLTTPDDLEVVSRLLAGLYRRFHILVGARRAHDLGSEEHRARPILEINQRRGHVLAPGRGVRAGAEDPQRAFLGAPPGRHARHGVHGVHPGSHRGALGRHHRRDRLRDAHALELVGLDASHAVPCPIHAGDATVHFPRTVHYTGPNRTGTPRLAWALEFGPRRGLGVRLMAKARLVWRRATR